MALPRRTLSTLVACGTGLGFASVSPAHAATLHTYQHGLYAQAHFATSSACDTARTSSLAALGRSGATSISAGSCHASDMTVGSTKTTAFLYDVTYRATKPFWPTDRDLGTAPVASAGAHSFRDKYSSPTMADATSHFTLDTSRIKALAGGKITLSRGVAKNSTTGRYEYEIDYDSRIPAFPQHVETSENPGVTSPATSTPATPHTYQHGLYAQGHYTSSAACASALTAFTAKLQSAGATSIAAGMCHPIDMTVGTTKASGYLFDVTYRATKPVASGDVDLGTSPALSAGAHSFRDKFSSSSLSDATTHFTGDTNKVKTLPGGTVTMSTGVTTNLTTGKYEYEIDYNSRIPAYTNHVESSEKPGVISPKPATPAVPATGMITTSNTSSTPSGQVVDKSTGQVLGIQGLDISAHTGTNDWSAWKAAGVKFIYTKATEGNYYTSPQFSAQYQGAYNAGMIRGAYHFANPASTTGAAQADYFIAHGGGWSGDGRTLPGVIDLEWNPYGDMCYGLTQAQMNTWARSFITEYKKKTGVNPAIYTAKIWWNKCVGTANYSDVPLWVAQYNTTLTGLPSSWSGTEQMIWQNSAVDSKGFDTNIFNGTLAQLSNYAATGRRN